jgi:succinate dehydrogenase flavin-adding protein (antitoxin of CptAB toxin-antitoxin module)
MPDQVDDGNVTQETDVDERLRHFETLIDKNDPEQVKMFEEMKRHTSMLHHVRGDWNKPNTFRHWNESSTANSVKRIPMESETYKKYKEHMKLEDTPLLDIAMGGEQCPRILGMPVGSVNDECQDVSSSSTG